VELVPPAPPARAPTVAGAPRRAEVRGRVLRPAGVVSELVMELSHEVDDMSVVILMRERAAPFDEHDRLVMRLLRPHVDAALRPYVHRVQWSAGASSTSSGSSERG
jgi:hypothetical protein